MVGVVGVRGERGEVPGDVTRTLSGCPVMFLKLDLFVTLSKNSWKRVITFQYAIHNDVTYIVKMQIINLGAPPL